MDGGAIIALGLFAVGVIYSAGKVANSVDNMREEFTALKDQIATQNAMTAATLSDHGERIGRIEGRLG